jgi:hypothetical protein
LYDGIRTVTQTDIGGGFISEGIVKSLSDQSGAGHQTSHSQKVKERGQLEIGLYAEIPCPLIEKQSSLCIAVDTQFHPELTSDGKPLGPSQKVSVLKCTVY